MKNLKDAKEIYDHIVVPEELDARLRETLENAVGATRAEEHVQYYENYINEQIQMLA